MGSEEWQILLIFSNIYADVVGGWVRKSPRMCYWDGIVPFKTLTFENHWTSEVVRVEVCSCYEENISAELPHCVRRLF